MKRPPPKTHMTLLNVNCMWNSEGMRKGNLRGLALERNEEKRLPPVLPLGCNCSFCVWNQSLKPSGDLAALKDDDDEDEDAPLLSCFISLTVSLPASTIFLENLDRKSKLDAV